ncbi:MULTISPECIES: four helix bundle protein [unclassified Mesorhizobium]|uniref:four helix bundle protein n=1 Tax=unclassified Mesorhizobium TaxID=325217 RepID=UPI001FCE1760|nr:MULTISPECIES: four helix bundle protein [unclassified Mesorhizobium]
MEKEGNYIKRAKDLEVYRRAYAVSLDVHRATLVFPKIEQYALADQMRRSSKAICANLAEGFAKQTHSRPEFARFISMALGSCSEMERGFPMPSILATSHKRSATNGCGPMFISMECW